MRTDLLALIAVFAVFFLVLSYVPLRATDLWGHVSYGDWMFEHRALPTEDPFMHLAQGVPVIDGAWLAQVLFALIYRAGGGEWLSIVFALTVLATHLLWARTFYLMSGRPLVSLLGVLAVLTVGWSRLFTIRPETFAALCFAALFWLVVPRAAFRNRADDEEAAGDGISARGEEGPAEWWLWIAVALLMALWTNLHGSFLLGPIVVGGFFAGRVLEVGARSRRLAAVLGDRAARRWFGLTVVAGLATLINPYGVELVTSALRFSANENLQAIIEWQPWTPGGIGGPELIASWVVLLAAFGLARRRVPIAHLLILIAFTVAVVRGVRFIGWYAPVFALVLVPQLDRLLPRWQRAAGSPFLHRARGLAGLSLIFFCLALSPLSRGLFDRPARSEIQLYGDSTPVNITRFLSRYPPREQVFHPQHWGDWLHREGPPGFRPFVTMNLHLAPNPVWQDYLRISSAEDGWEEALDRYQVNTVIIERRRQARLMRALGDAADWRLASPPDDPQALAFARVAPLESEGEPVDDR